MTPKYRRIARLVGGLIAGAALFSACTNSSSTKTSSATTPDSPGDTTGITANTIKIAWIVPGWSDEQMLVKAGMVPNLNTVAMGQAIADSWNKAGGIDGRQVQLVLGEYNPLATDSTAELQQVCLSLTEDQQVFLGITVSFYGDALTCFSGTHGTPLVTGESDPQAVLDTAQNNVFVANFTWEHAIEATVSVLKADGKLGMAKKIGIYADDEPGMRPAIDNALLPALHAAGITPADTAIVPFNGAGNPDPAAVGAVVSRFKQEGIDGVFPLGNLEYNNQFMTSAQSSGYHPTYFLSDLSDATDAIAGKFEPPAQLANAVGVSWQAQLADPLPTAAARQCAATYAPGQPPAGQLVAAQTCELFDLTREGLVAAAAKGGITRTSFIAGMESLSSFTTSAGTPGGFSPTKHDMPTEGRIVTFDAKGCQCWVPQGNWIKVISG